MDELLNGLVGQRPRDPRGQGPLTQNICQETLSNCNVKLMPILAFLHKTVLYSHLEM